MNMGSDLWNISTPHHIQQLNNSFISRMIISNFDYINFPDFKINNMVTKNIESEKTWAISYYE